MSRRAGVWFGRPSAAPSTLGPSRTPHSQRAEQVELAVVFKDIATYRPYKPGTGPRLRPITLIPTRDTTAYIREEFFIPHTLSQDGKKRLQYVVGWTDLPAARLVVDAEVIADYVSPLAYEEWCAARAAERDEEERRKEEEENVRLVAEAEAREKGLATLRSGAVKETQGKKAVGWKGGKRKRRTKAQMEAARAITPIDDDGEKKKKKPGRPRKNAPSLSTPSKAQLDEFRELETEAEPETEAPDDEEEAIFRQLNGEDPYSVAEGEYDSGDVSSVPGGSEPPSKKQRTISPGAPLSRLLPGIETDSSRSTPFDSSRGATSSPALPPLPNPPKTSQPGRLLQPHAFPSVPQASANNTSTPPATVKKVTPVFPPMPHKRSLLSVRDPPSSSSSPPHPRPTSSKAQTPTPKQWQPPPDMKETAIEPPVNSTAIKSKPRTESAPAAMPPSHLSTTPNSTSTPRTGFTPLGKSSIPWSASQPVTRAPLLTPSASQPVQSTERPSSSSTTNPKPTQPPKRSPAQGSIHVKHADIDRDELAEDVYEVLRLEGLQVRHIRGKPVRYFAVRWKGNWPPGENPTWEPETNIPPHMVKKYLVANPTPRKGSTGTLDRYLIPDRSQRKFSSVSEAFEGFDADGAAAKAEEDEAVEEEGDEEGAVEEEEDGEGDEMLIVTDEPAPTVKPTLSW